MTDTTNQAIAEVLEDAFRGLYMTNEDGDFVPVYDSYNVLKDGLAADIAKLITEARIDQVHKDLGGYSYSMPMKSMRTRNTAFKLYAVKFFNTKIKERRESQLAQLKFITTDGEGE
jgi:hypothetical protein